MSLKQSNSPEALGLGFGLPTTTLSMKRSYSCPLNSPLQPLPGAFQTKVIGLDGFDPEFYQEKRFLNWSDSGNDISDEEENDDEPIMIESRKLKGIYNTSSTISTRSNSPDLTRSGDDSDSASSVSSIGSERIGIRQTISPDFSHLVQFIDFTSPKICTPTLVKVKSLRASTVTPQESPVQIQMVEEANSPDRCALFSPSPSTSDLENSPSIMDLATDFSPIPFPTSSSIESSPIVADKRSSVLSRSRPTPRSNSSSSTTTSTETVVILKSRVPTRKRISPSFLPISALRDPNFQKSKSVQFLATDEEVQNHLNSVEERYQKELIMDQLNKKALPRIKKSFFNGIHLPRKAKRASINWKKDIQIEVESSEDSDTDSDISLNPGNAKEVSSNFLLRERRRSSIQAIFNLS